MAARTAAIVFVVSLDGQTVYLARRSDIAKSYPGRLECVGGSVEPEESIEDAAVRELYEETGLIADPKFLEYRSMTVFARSTAPIHLFVYRANVPPKNFTEPGKRGPWIPVDFHAYSQYVNALTPATAMLWHLLQLESKLKKSDTSISLAQQPVFT